jgi:peptide/nickel transport system substrate-binding protein
VARHLTAALLAIALISAPACNRSPAPSVPAASGPVRGGSLTASTRSAPLTFNRLAPNGAQATVDAITKLLHAPLVRLNRATGEPEPWLAEKWTTSPDGKTITLTLRDGVTFSDGAPFTSADVVFTFRALYDPKVASALASGVNVQHKPLEITAPDPRTVVITMPMPFTPGVALLDNVPIYPKHLLQAAFDAGTFGSAWGTTTPPSSMAGLGPFVLSDYAAGQRMTFTRNPRYWRKDASGTPLPYLDRIVMEVVPAQDAEMLRLQAGEVDVMAVAAVRPEDIAGLRKLRDQGTVQLVDVGVSVDPDTLWFNLTPGNAAVKAKPYLGRMEFRQAISHAVDRNAIAQTVFLGAAEPVYGPITSGNKTWYSPSAPTYPHDPAKAKALLASVGLVDRNGDGMLDDAKGKPVRFSIITQAGHIRERTATMIQEQLRQVGVGVDIVSLDPPSIFGRFGAGDYESIYYGFQASAFDPAVNLDFWMSGGSGHVWNTGAPEPWEKAIDALMVRQSAAPSLSERQQLLRDAERIFAEHLPQIYFVAPKVTIALSRRVGGAMPVLLDPKILWNAESLFVRP